MVGIILTLLPARIVRNLCARPLVVAARASKQRLHGVLVLSPAGLFDLHVAGTVIHGEWTMLPSGHEILDRVWDTIKFETTVNDVHLQCTARLYARHDHMRFPITSHATVLAWREPRPLFRRVVATLQISNP